MHVVRRRRTRTPPRQTRWARRRFRTTSTARTRAPSIGSTRTLRPERARPCLLFTRTAFAPHPVACREPWPPRQRQAGRFKLSRLRHDSPLGSSLGRQERCVSPTSATDQRLEHPLDCPIPESASPRAFRPSEPRRPALGQWPPADPRVELRLTANLQLRRRRDPQAPRLGPGPQTPTWADAARSWRSLDQKLLRAAPPGRGVFDREPSLRRSL
jgi:hypothetical protein